MAGRGVVSIGLAATPPTMTRIEDVRASHSVRASVSTYCSDADKCKSAHVVNMERVASNRPEKPAPMQTIEQLMAFNIGRIGVAGNAQYGKICATKAAMRSRIMIMSEE